MQFNVRYFVDQEEHQRYVELPDGQSIRFFFGSYNAPYRCGIGSFYCNASDLISITPITKYEDHKKEIIKAVDAVYNTNSTDEVSPNGHLCNADSSEGV